MGRIDVSVVIPAYNARHTICAAIESALLQQGVALEVVVVDDCSTDQTSEVVADLRDRRVLLLKHIQNAGPGAARNTAIAHASGAWIAVLDADDSYLPGRLALLIDAAVKSDAQIIADNAWAESATGQRSLLARISPSSPAVVDLTAYVLANEMFGDTGVSWGYLKPVFDRQFLEAHRIRYRTDLRIGEDFELVLRALAEGARFVIHGSAGYVYRRQRPDSLSFRLTTGHCRDLTRACDEFGERYLASLSSTEAAAVKRYRRALVDGGAFLSMLESAKSMRLAGLLRTAATNPRALRLFSPRNFRWSAFRRSKA